MSSALGLRSNVIGEAGFGDQDQDANSALTELDKGLRSGKVGEQCEAIVRFPRLFEKYPFPILINSACLKLAEVFRVGTNFLRVLILKVVQQSEKHLDKILNMDEFVRRLYCVIYSNDPVARALTLRTLGSIAIIIPEKKNIHHSIRHSLDSHDVVELEAAIFAAACFAAHSKTFACNICTKIADMIQGLATPVSMKLKLLTVFQHMHHDAQIVGMVRNLCTKLLPSYPSQKFVAFTLHTLTELASSSLTGISDQVELLVQYLENDSRRLVKLEALKGLKQLAEKGPHFWAMSDIEKVVEYALQTPYLEIKCQVVNVLVMLAKSPAVDKFDISPGCQVLALCNTCMYSTNVTLASVSISLLTRLAIHAFQEDIVIEGTDLIQEVSTGIEAVLLVVCMEGNNQPSHVAALKNCLCCAVSLCEVNSDLCLQFVDAVGSLLSNTSGPCVVPLCEALCSLGSRRVGVMTYLQSELVAMVHRFISQPRQSAEDAQSLVVACTLLFQAAVDRSWTHHDNSIIWRAVQSVDLWCSYKIARQATRYGHHHVAGQIFSYLCNRVSSEHHHFWLVSLWEMSQAEATLVGNEKEKAANLDDRVMQAVTHYVKAISSLKAATTPVHTLAFHCEYARLRCEVLQAFYQLLQTSLCVKTSPPPAIASAFALQTRDELQKCGKIVNQLRKCSKEFRGLADQYGSLYQSVFDADPLTLNNIQILQQSCLLAAQTIDKISQHGQGMGLSLGMGEEDVTTIEQCQQTLENHRILEACRKCVAWIRDIDSEEDVKARTIGRQQTELLIKVCQELVQVPLCFPRFFYQTLQSTSIKLAISPQPKVAGDAILVQNNVHLAVKVEGVVQHGKHPGLYRKVAKVLLTVSSTLQSRASTFQENAKLPSDISNIISRAVVPHNDYFHAQFLLAFPLPGLHIVTVEASVIDEQEAQWNTGPRMTLSVKAHEDAATVAAAKQQASTSRGMLQSRF